MQRNCQSEHRCKKLSGKGALLQYQYWMDFERSDQHQIRHCILLKANQMEVLAKLNNMNAEAPPTTVRINLVPVFIRVFVFEYFFPYQINTKLCHVTNGCEYCAE
jgi:hypothetical protein